MSTSKLVRSQRGQAALELLLALLILVPLLFGALELARGVTLRHALDSGVGVAVRALSLTPDEWGRAQTLVQDALDNNLLGVDGTGALTLQAYNSAGGSLSPAGLSALAFGETFCLEARADFTPLLPLVGGQTVSMRARHCATMERYP